MGIEGKSTFTMSNPADLGYDSLDNPSNLVIDHITWRFTPKTVYKTQSYKITLEFKDKVTTTEKWEAETDIYIEKSDLLAEVGFQTNVNLYNEITCEKAKDQ